MTSSTKIMLIACGSFSPPTPMHFRMFEIARDHFQQIGTHQVIGGIVSPVHDAYGKKGLVSASHRCMMLKIALQSSDWIRVSDWETQQEEWTRTRLTLQYHQNYINSYLKDINGTVNNQHLAGWIPENLKKTTGHVQVKLLCGADLLESFSTPGLWQQDDLEAILGQHGIVVISRSGSNPEQFIFNSDLLSRYRRNITIVTNWVANEVSSTLARRFIGRGLSVKYLLDDYVVEYIRKNGLYGSSDTKYILTANLNDMMSISPTSPTNDNEKYIERQNQMNQFHSIESMDETDYSSKELTLNKVFCCGNDNKNAGNVRSLLNHPGGAVQIITSSNIDHIEDKVGGDDKINNDGTDALSLDKNCTIDNISDEEKGDVTLSTTIPSNDTSLSTTGRISPSKSYNDMIKFVFTEHGIRVISDREYVV